MSQPDQVFVLWIYRNQHQNGCNVDQPLYGCINEMIIIYW